ncbi:hypothetical protein B5566_02650 [Mycobacterium sp. MHSD3]|nr:hypothetical protein B5566_02650 [Mycobacterium sp. MHSD3]
MINDLVAYQRHAASTAIYPGAADLDSYEGLAYVTLGLAGEAGELANKVKKIARDFGGQVTNVDRAKLADELGDCLWYVAQFATQLGIDLDAIANTNLAKLHSRQVRGVLQGSGDQR